MTQVPVYALSGSSDSSELAAARLRAFSDSPEHLCFFDHVALQVPLQRRRLRGTQGHLSERPVWVSSSRLSVYHLTGRFRPEAAVQDGRCSTLFGVTTMLYMQSPLVQWTTSDTNRKTCTNRIVVPPETRTNFSVPVPLLLRN